MGSTYKNRLVAILNKFGVEPSQLGIQLSQDIKLSAEAKTADGTMLYTSADAWTAGVDIYVLDETGNPVPAPAGEYALEDGSVLMVGADGLVAEIRPVAAAEEAMSAEDWMKVVESLSARITDLENANVSLGSQLNDAKTNTSEHLTTINTLKTQLSAISKQPAVGSVKERVEAVVSKTAPATPNKSFDNMTIKERIQFNLNNQ